MNLTIRWRLTLWYGTAMAVCFAVFAAAVYVLTSRSQSARIDFELSEELHELQHDVVTMRDRQELLDELRAEFGKHPDYEFEILQPDGSVLFRSQRLGARSLRTARPSDSQGSEAARFLELPGLGRYRVKAQSVDSPHGRLLLQTAIPLESIEAAQRTLWRTLCLVGPLMLLAAMAGGYMLARRALAPVDEITATAERITAQRLDQRLPVPAVHDELSRLARTLNEMMDRLQHSFAEMRRFTADAAHELRTPITLLRTQLDVALRQDRTTSEYRQVLLSLHDDVQHLSRLATQLLELSREDAGLNAESFAPVPLRSVLLSAVEELRLAAEQKSQAIEVGLLADHHVLGDADRLQRAFVNLLDNAIKFTPPNGRIRVSLKIEEATASDADARTLSATIQDTGCGIAAEHLPHIFDRFYRADPSRSTTHGTGLGLAICQAIVTAHHGTLHLTSQPNEGTKAKISLPAMT